MTDPFGDIPLFREIQRLLSSNQGPLNYEIARQIGRSLAGQSGVDLDAPAVYREAVKSAQDFVSGFTQLTSEPLTFRIMDRPQWVETTLDEWKWLLDAVAARFGALGATDDPSRPGDDPLQLAVAQISPLLVGIQTGTLVGNIAKVVLGHYDAPIPRERPGLVFVQPNVTELIAAYQLDPAFIRWLCLREVAHDLVTSSVAWIGRYWRSLLTEIVAALEIDTADIERRFMELQSQGLDALGEGMAPDSLLPVVPNPRHTAALDRLRAFGALLTGYASYVLQEVGATVIGEQSARFSEAATRHEADHDDAIVVLRDVMGLLPDRNLGPSGRTFCTAVVKLHGIHTLNRIWEAPDNLPSLEEIKDPFQWLERLAV